MSGIHTVNRFRRPMPICYTIDRTRQLVVTTCSGRVTYDDLLEHARRLRGDPEFDPELSELIDARNFSSTNLNAALLGSFSEVTDPFAIDSRRAVVAESDFAFGIGRMYQALRVSENFGVFRTTGEAWRWLATGSQG